MSSKDRYKENRTRVFEIYDIDPDDKRYNCHHIVEQSDYKRDKKFWDDSVPNGRFDINMLSNLAPVKLEEHAWINRRINGDGIPQKKKEKVRHKKKVRHKRPSRRQRHNKRRW